MIEWTMRRLNISIPWKYYNGRDTRTVFRWAGFVHRDPTMVTAKIPHHALEDAIAQTHNVKEAYRRLFNPMTEQI